MTKKKCEECGVEEDSLIQGYCTSCYAKKWDEGFESTSEHAYEIGYADDMAQLKGVLGPKAEEALRDIFFTWGVGEWKCGKCGAARVKKGEELTFDQAKGKILGPCPKCGVVGYLVRTPPKKYFH
ncbi:hypothetical protein GF342_02215 [Candidatus Woesearchaeota archaeon]|nr:hypothetical protein [Candidatus Woesearchaeota archaeon]